jgi:outer membrane protein assembly factor BamB
MRRNIIATSTLLLIIGYGRGWRNLSGQVAVPRPGIHHTLSPLWNVAGQGRGLPTADSTTAYFLSSDHAVTAVDTATGAIRWKQSTGEPGDSTQGSAVVVAGATIVAGDYDLIGFDRTTGAIRWRFVPTDGYAPGIFLGAQANGVVYSGSGAGRAYAVDEATGKVRWSTLVVPGGMTTAYEPVADADIVAVSYTTFTAPAVGGVAVIDAASGRLRWRTPFPRPSNASLNTNTTGSLVVTPDSIIAPAGDGEVVAFDRSTGAVRWIIPKLTGVAPGFGPTEYDIRTVARIGNTLFTSSLFGYVVAYSLETRNELWRYDGTENGSVGTRMTTDDRTLYVPFISLRLVALNASNGTERWGIGDEKSPFTWPAFPFGDRVFVSSYKAGYFAFPRDDPQSIGRRPRPE